MEVGREGALFPFTYGDCVRKGALTNLGNNQTKPTSAFGDGMMRNVIGEGTAGCKLVSCKLSASCRALVMTYVSRMTVGDLDFVRQTGTHTRALVSSLA
jgi:hypothetical protein